MGEGIGSRGHSQIFVVYMGVYLCGVQVLVPEHFLKSAYVDAVLEHQRRRGVAELVSRILRAVESGLGKIFLDEAVYRRFAYPAVS